MSSEIRSLGPIERVMYLRTLPLFGSMPAEDLGAIAEWTEEREFASGETLLEEGAPVESIHILTSGSARVSRGEQAFRVFGPRDALGIIGLLSRDPLGVRAVALERCTTLELGQRPLVRMFEERFGIFEHLLREVSRLLDEERGDEVVAESAAIDPDWVMPPFTAAEMDLVDRMQWLGAGFSFARRHPLALSRLARMTEVRRVEVGSAISSDNDAPGTVVIATSGSVALQHPGGASSSLGLGAAFGITSALAERGSPHRLVAEEPSTLLIVEKDSLLDVFEDHPSLALDCLSDLASNLLAVFMQRARAEVDVPRGLGAGHRIADALEFDIPDWESFKRTGKLLLSRGYG